MKDGNAGMETVILGAGPVGATLACALARSHRIVLCARAPAGPTDDDRRGLALTVASRSILASLGVWDHLGRDRVAALRRMRVCAADECVVFDAA
ncbi:MAG: hypothetical protein ACYCQK_00720, partial [Acidiferrobacteraceae bacterium]